MSFLQLLLLFRSLPIRELLDYPDDLQDTQDVRRWLVAVCQAGDVLADTTDTTIDDSVVNALKEVVEDEIAFSAIYDLVLNFFDYEKEGTPYTQFDKDVEDAAAKVSFSPTLIIAIVQVVIMILKFIRQRRGE